MNPYRLSHVVTMSGSSSGDDGELSIEEEASLDAAYRNGAFRIELLRIALVALLLAILEA